MTTKITATGLDQMIAYCRDLQGPAQRRAHEALDQALSKTIEASQALAHVSDDERHAGALKASGEASSEHAHKGWTGTVQYVDRGALYEMQRGGDHAQFVDSLAHLSAEAFQDALDVMFGDG